MSRSRTVRHTALAAALLTLALAAPAAAHTAASPRPTQAPKDTMPPDRSGRANSAFDHVANFYGAYIDAKQGSGDRRLAQELRRHYLTADLRRRLADWEAKHTADGVLRAKGAPTAWRVSYEDSGMGHTWTRVRLTWGTGSHPAYTYLSLQSDLATRLVSDIRTTTAER